jgi:hypothetical protein
LGVDKLEILQQAKVAVVNPTGKGETFCITALEFELLGVPVVTKNVGGPRNVVDNGETGILYERERDLPAAVIRLLKDEPLRQRMGQEGIRYGREHFDIAVIIRKWEQLLSEVASGRGVTPDYAMSPGSTREKRVKEWNRKLKRIPLLQWLPSIDYWTHAYRKKKHSLVTKPLRFILNRPL